MTLSCEGKELLQEVKKAKEGIPLKRLAAFSEEAVQEIKHVGAIREITSLTRGDQRMIVSEEFQ